MLVQFTQFTKVHEELNLGDSTEHINRLDSLRLIRDYSAVQFMTNSGNDYTIYCSDMTDCEKIFSGLRNALTSENGKIVLLRRACCSVPISDSYNSSLVEMIRKLNSGQVSKGIQPVACTQGMKIQSTCAMTDDSSIY